MCVLAKWVRDNKKAVYNWTQIPSLNAGSQTMMVACWAEQSSSLLQAGTCVLVVVTVLFLFYNYSAGVTRPCN